MFSDEEQARASATEGVSDATSLPPRCSCLPRHLNHRTPGGQLAALIPEHLDTHPLGCHNPRIADRVVFDKLIQVLVLGAAYERIADRICSATTIRSRRDGWISAGIFTRP